MIIVIIINNKNKATTVTKRTTTTGTTSMSNRSSGRSAPAANSSTLDATASQKNSSSRSSGSRSAGRAGLPVSWATGTVAKALGWGLAQVPGDGAWRDGPVRKSRFTEEQIAVALRQAEAGTPVGELCRRLGITETTFYRWKRKYGGLGVSELRELRQLRDENRRLKHLVADLTLDKRILQESLGKEW